METKKNVEPIKSDLLYESVVKDCIKKIEEIKTWIINASTGQIELFEPASLERLQDLNFLQLNLDNLKDNLNAGQIKFDFQFTENQ